MNSMPIEVSETIIEFLPVSVQMNVSKQSRANTKSMTKIKKSIYKIRSSMKKHRNRIMMSVFIDNDTEDMRSGLGLYIPKNILDGLLNHIMMRGDPFYKQNVFTMCIDERNMTPYSDEIKDIVMLGTMLDWTPKKTFRNAIKRMDHLDLKSLMLTFQ